MKTGPNLTLQETGVKYKKKDWRGVGHIKSLVRGTSATLNQQVVESYAGHFTECSCSQKHGEEGHQKLFWLTFYLCCFLLFRKDGNKLPGEHKY